MGSGGSGSDQAVALVRGDKLLVVGSDGQTTLYRYALNPVPAIEPMTDSASQGVKQAMKRIVDAYVACALTDVANQHAGPDAALKVTGATELLHDTPHAAAVATPHVN
jgi:hypothetical protein